MNQETKNLIQSRARRLFPYLADHLNYQNPNAHEEGHCYRYTYLIQKGPKAFLNAFRYGDLHLDPEAIASIFWQLRGEIPGPAGLMAEELQIIATHNREVTALEQKATAYAR